MAKKRNTSSRCFQCDAKCCRYISLEIDTPETGDDYQNIIWYVLHRGISVYIEGGTWYLLVENECEALTADNRCGIYQHRPQICRDHGNRDCELDNPEGYYDELLRTREDVNAYIKRNGIIL